MHTVYIMCRLLNICVFFVLLVIVYGKKTKTKSKTSNVDMNMNSIEIGNDGTAAEQENKY